MKIPSSYIRKKLFALLNNNVSYDGNTVPVYESQAEPVGRAIVIGEYSDADTSNKHGFGADATQVIEVVAVQGTAIKEHVDAIGELVNNLIKPTTQSFNLDGTDFSIIVSRPSINHLIERGDAANKIVRLILRYSLKIGHN
jgi:hypothetical protein